MEWAKGLKDRVERTAGELKSQAATAFTPPDDDQGEEGAEVSKSPEPPTENNSGKPTPGTPPPSTQGDAAADALTRVPLPQSM